MKTKNDKTSQSFMAETTDFSQLPSYCKMSLSLFYRQFLDINCPYYIIFNSFFELFFPILRNCVISISSV